MVKSKKEMFWSQVIDYLDTGYLEIAFSVLINF
jgi:hypothetical protein